MNREATGQDAAAEAIGDENRNSLLDAMLEAARSHGLDHQPLSGAAPERSLAVVTCMDRRIDVNELLGLRLGDAHVLRNAGGRVTEDVLRSLAVSVAILGVRTVVLMQHLGCGMYGTTDDALRARTGAPFDFQPIADHSSALAEDAGRIMQAPYLSAVEAVAGWVFDVEAGTVEEVLRRARSY